MIHVTRPLSLKALLLALMAAGSATAHHSYAMFDMARELTLRGTVREFQFVNPHCFIQLVVPDGEQTVEWSIEMGAPTHLLRAGWKRNSLKPGDRISVTINPLRDGGYGGGFVSATGADGKVIGSP